MHRRFIGGAHPPMSPPSTPRSPSGRYKRRHGLITTKNIFILSTAALVLLHRNLSKYVTNDQEEIHSEKHGFLINLDQFPAHRDHREDPKLPKGMKKKYDVCVVGAGLSGSVLAERFATTQHKSVLIVEKRNHIGGNCFDYIDPQTGIRVNKYGAHLFHTNSKRVWNYVHQFSNWTKYEHKVLGYVNKTYVPIPVNIDTVNLLFDAKITNSDEMDNWLNDEQVKYDHDPINSEEMALNRVGERLYGLIFKGYTFKQWAKYPAELGPEVTSRIPVRNDYDDRYFPNDKYQALPSEGYTKFFENLILNRNRIDVFTNIDYFDVKDSLHCGQT